MSLLDEIFNSGLEHFETTTGQTFQLGLSEYQAIAATETKEEDYEETGRRYHWRVLIEATVAQFGETPPSIRQKITYNGRPYSIRSIDQDAHTYKLTCTTVSS